MIKYLVSCLLLLTANFVQAQQWPRTLQAKNGGTVTMYQPQPEKLEGNIVTGRTAVSVKQKSTDDPIFGALWFTATMETNRDNRMAVLQSINIRDVKLPGIEDTATINKLKAFLETEIPRWKLQVTIDDIATAAEAEQKITAENLKNDPPKIIYTTTPSLLVMIDGEPKLQQDDKLNMQRVINTAFLIVQYPKDKQYYLYGGSNWYLSSSVISGWKVVKALPKDIQELDKQIKEQEQKQQQTKSAASTETPPALVVATAPTELVQSKGEANFATITGTKLLYVSNSDDHIFMDINTNKYYVLLSGRWYTSSSLKGPWVYVASDQLPADFAKIPKGSEKDIVLASVAGTDEAHDAVMDAQIPQTAKVDRKTATCTIKYDGEPKFEKIEGTSLFLAQNTSSTVIRSGNDYYAVENGVWFKSSKPDGPWQVSDDRPKDVDNIPASSEAYNTKYVYIYESTPQYVYVGYTPGYMGCYVYGPVVVYGTGYYYNPWYGIYYYPRPVTYGFSMHYNPWTGWSMGFHYSYGYFSFHYYTGGYHGYWGPPVYRPPYYPRYHGGMYGGRGPTYIGGDVNINIDNSNNIYNRRNGVSTNNVKRSNITQAKPATSNIKNNTVTDKQGNVFRKNQQGNWQQRDGSTWKPASNNAANDMNKQMQNRERSQNLNNNFNQSNRLGNPGAGAKKPVNTNSDKVKKR